MLQVGIVELPNCRMHWTPNYCNDLIAESITQDRFDQIMMVLHFNDNNSMSRVVTIARFAGFARFTGKRAIFLVFAGKTGKQYHFSL